MKFTPELTPEYVRKSAFLMLIFVLATILTPLIFLFVG